MRGNIFSRCFATNKIHYARYGTFYIQRLKHLDSTHPGAFEEICEMVLVRRNKTGIGQAIDLAGEQTHMRNAITAGFLLSLSNLSSFVYLSNKISKISCDIKRSVS